MKRTEKSSPPSKVPFCTAALVAGMLLLTIAGCRKDDGESREARIVSLVLPRPIDPQDPEMSQRLRVALNPVNSDLAAGDSLILWDGHSGEPITRLAVKDSSR